MASQYEIVINEYQRALMVKVMEAGAMFLRSELEDQQGDQSSIAPMDNSFDEIIAICEVFAKMPDVKDPDPFVLNV